MPSILPVLGILRVDALSACPRYYAGLVSEKEPQVSEMSSTWPLEGEVVRGKVVCWLEGNGLVTLDLGFLSSFLSRTIQLVIVSLYVVV